MSVEDRGVWKRGLSVEERMECGREQPRRAKKASEVNKASDFKKAYQEAEYLCVPELV